MDRKEIWEAYEKYLGKKCSRSTYLNRIQKGIPFNEALKPVDRKNRHPVGNIVTKKFGKEMIWYHEQKGEKPIRQVFYQRLYRGYSKEEAIKIDWTPKEKKMPTQTNPGYVRPIKRKLKVVDDGGIKIKYSKEEADVIRREYEKMIDEIEYKWRACEDPIEAKSIYDKVDKLKNEYKTFCLINY